MKVLICGGRDFDDYDMMANLLSELRAKHPQLEIVSGGARGADSLADYYAQTNGVKITVMKADWDTHGKGAGIIRNNQMLDLVPDLVLAFWDGRSRGTLHTIEEARRRGLETKVMSYSI